MIADWKFLLYISYKPKCLWTHINIRVECFLFLTCYNKKFFVSFVLIYIWRNLSHHFDVFSKIQISKQIYVNLTLKILWANTTKFIGKIQSQNWKISKSLFVGLKKSSNFERSKCLKNEIYVWTFTSVNVSCHLVKTNVSDIGVVA